MTNSSELRKLIKDLLSNDPETSQRAGKFLSRRKDPETFVALIEALGETNDKELKMYIMDIMFKIMKNNENLPKKLWGSPLIDRIIKAAKKIDASTLHSLAYGYLYRIRDPRLAPVFLESVRGLGIRRCYNADEVLPLIAALVEMEPPPVDVLINALRDENQCIRDMAILALGYIGDGRAAEPLIEILLDPNVDDMTKELVENSLKILGEGAVDPLIRILRDKKRGIEIRKVVAHILIHLWLGLGGEHYLAEYYGGDWEVFQIPPVPDFRIVDALLEALREKEIQDVFLEHEPSLEFFAVGQLLLKVRVWFNDPEISDAVEKAIEGFYGSYGSRFLNYVAQLLEKVDDETKDLLKRALKRILEKYYRGESLEEIHYLLRNLTNCNEATIQVLRDVIEHVFRVIYREHGSAFVNLVIKCSEQFNEKICRVLNKILVEAIGTNPRAPDHNHQ